MIQGWDGTWTYVPDKQCPWADRGMAAGSVCDLPLQTSMIQEISGSRYDLGKLTLLLYSMYAGRVFPQLFMLVLC